jgi:hypothetical protein
MSAAVGDMRGGSCGAEFRSVMNVRGKKITSV